MRIRALAARSSAPPGSYRSYRTYIDGLEEPIMKRFPEHQLNAKIRRSRDVTALSRLAMLLFCGLILAGGFVFAAKQHFAAVQFGYENETLRTERKRLIEENQRLALEKERAIAPDKLEPAARKLGLKPARPGQIGNKPRIDTD
jgi:cell division protein FtsL